MGTVCVRGGEEMLGDNSRRGKEPGVYDCVVSYVTLPSRTLMPRLAAAADYWLATRYYGFHAPPRLHCEFHEPR